MAFAPLPVSNQQYIPESMKFFSKLSARYKETFEWYREWVIENPEVVSQVEKTFRIFSYFITGFTDDSEVLSEFVYALANLLVFFNDSIMRRAWVGLHPQLSLSQHHIQRWLTVLNHVEVFLELTSRHLWGEPGKWVVIAGIQLLRTILRLVLLLACRSGLQSCPPIPPLNRKLVSHPRAVPSSVLAGNNESGTTLEGEHGTPDTVPMHRSRTATFEGRRSGRVIRMLHATPGAGLRTWTLPASDQLEEEEEDVGVTELAGFSLAAETLYISRPLLHLWSLCVWGWESWKPWMISVGADIVSLEMMKRDRYVKFNSRERSELVTRRLVLLFYLLRSPFYSSVTRSRLERLLNCTGDRIPCARLMTRPLLDYLPVWQKIYFYNWGY